MSEFEDDEVRSGWKLSVDSDGLIEVSIIASNEEIVMVLDDAMEARKFARILDAMADIGSDPY